MQYNEEELFMKDLSGRGGTGRRQAWEDIRRFLSVGVLSAVCFCFFFASTPVVSVLYGFEPSACTADDGDCMLCATGYWCCKSDKACFDPSKNSTCAYTGCSGAACTAANVCKKVAVTPTLTPQACTAADGDCGKCGAGYWCCKSDHTCFDPRTNQNCAGSCANASCTSDNICEQRRSLPRTCTAGDGTADKKCTSCAEGQVCCARDGQCIDASNTTCDGTACAGDYCNTGPFNLCVREKSLVSACTTGHGLEKCLNCAAGQYCCMETGSCFDKTANCAYTACSGENCNGAQVCEKKALTCPDWTHKITFTNSSSETIWIAAIPSCYKKDNVDTCHPVPSPGGWKVAPSGVVDVDVPACWSGGFLFRTDCTFDKGPTKSEYCDNAPCCKTGDCQGSVDGTMRSAFVCSRGGLPPATRIEMTFDGGLDDEGGKIQSLTDTYDISFVDGWTKMVTMKPTGTNWNPVSPDPAKQEYWCSQSGCDNAPACPEPLAFTDSKKTHTYCWAPVAFSRKLHEKDATFDVTYNKKTTTYTNNDAFKAKISCVCSATANVSCADPPKSTTINAACNDPNGTKDCYGCSPYSEPGASHLYSQCCPWSTADGKSCGWNPDNAVQSKRIWPDWARDYITNIKNVCAKAYTWQYDDAQSTYTCVSKDYGSAVNYAVTIYDGGGKSATVTKTKE